jgi:hypothetical protein
MTMPRSLPSLLLVAACLSACGGSSSTTYKCPIEMNAAGTMTSGTETFTYLSDAKAVQMKTMVAGEMKTVNLPATLSGDELSFNSLGSEPIFYKLNLKTLALNVRSDVYNPTDGSLALTGTGQCSPQ